MKKLDLPNEIETTRFNSKIYWNNISNRRDPSGTMRKMVPVECGKCDKIRFFRIDYILRYGEYREIYKEWKRTHRNSKTSKERNTDIRKEFYGLCRNCTNKLTWEDKHRNKPLKRKTTDHGYMKIFLGKHHPMTDKRGEIYEHRLVMSRILNRPLKRYEHVHHKNGNKADNRPENLELLPKGEHRCVQDLQTRIKYLESLLTKHNILFQ